MNGWVGVNADKPAERRMGCYSLVISKWRTVCIREAG